MASQCRIKEAPPFAIKTDDGRWRGISVDLRCAAAERLGLRYALMATDLERLRAHRVRARIDERCGLLQ